MNLFDIFESEEKFTLYFDGNPVATYTNINDAEYQTRLIQKKVPNLNFEIKKEVCSYEPVQLKENLRKWFKEKWVRFGPDGKIRGDCARGDDSEGKPKCLPQSKAHSLGKKGRASAAARKRREDPNPERSGKAINVNTKKKSNEGVAEGGPFSYGAKKPRRGSVADLAAKTRKEQDKNHKPIEPKDQMVGTAKVTKGVAEGSMSAEEYKQKLISTIPGMMDFFEKTVKGWKPSKEQMLAAVETGYIVMKRTGDVQQAGKAVMDELNTLHRMSQGQQGVTEGSEQQWVVTVGTKTGGTSHTMTFSGTKEQAIKKAVARFGTSKNPVVTAKPKQQGVAEGYSTMWEVSFDYGPHMSETVKVKAGSEEEAIAKVEKAAEKRGRSIMVNWAKPAEQGVAEGLNEGQYEMMMRNGQVKKFVAKDDADAKRIAKGHGAKSVIRLKGGIPAGKVSEQGVSEAFGPLPRDNQQIRLGRHTVDIERVGLNKNYISFAWHDSKGQEHYEEVPVGDLGSYDDLIKKIKQEISYQERQYTDQGVAEGLAKNIKRTVQGWRKDEPTPQSIKKRADQYTDDELKALASEYDDLRSVRLSAGLSPERPKHSPEGLQKRLIDRKMKKRGLKEQGVAEGKLDEKCWDTHKQVGMKNKGGKMVPNCVPKESVHESEKCPHCGGPMFEETMMTEKKDACYYKVKSRYKVWPSAYASGALVKCRKKGAKNWGSKNESKLYYTVTGTDPSTLRNEFNMSRDRNGWYLREDADKPTLLEAFRAFGAPRKV